MPTNDKKFYVPSYSYTTGEPDEHPRMKLMEVSEAVYQAYYQQIWRTRDLARRTGGCSTADWKKCIGDCGLCIYHTAGSCRSYEDLTDCEEDRSLQLADIAEQAAEEILLSDLPRMVAALNAEEQFICRALASGQNEREAAEQLGLSKSTYHDHKERLLKKLKEEWRDLI